MAKTTKKGFGKRVIAVFLSLVMMTSLFNISALAAPGDRRPGSGFPGNWGGGYVLDESYYKADRKFGWDTYTEGATMLDENNNDVYEQITVKVGGNTLSKGVLSNRVTTGDVVENGVTISGIPAGFYISAYKIVCEKYACYTDQAGNATDEDVSLDAGKGSYSVSVSKADMGHANVGATRYWILIELSAYEEEKETIVTYPYSVFYNYGELTDVLAGAEETTDRNTYAMNATATILSPAAEEAAAELGYTFVNWEVEKVEGSFAVTNGVVGSFVDPADSLTITGETTLKAVWQKIPEHTLTVNWVNQKGEALAEQVVSTLQEGRSYSTEQKNIDGYVFLKTEGDAVSGTMDSDKEVTYVYEKDAPPPPPAPVYYTLVVNYVDEAGAALAASESESKKEGASYSTTAREIEGYSLKETRGDAASGTMDTDKEVTYVYEKDAPPPPAPEPPAPPVVVKYRVIYQYVGKVPAGAPAVPGTEHYKPSTKVSVEAEPSLEGYTFSGWSTDDTDISGDEFRMPRKTVTLEGSWVKIPPAEYNLVVKYVDEEGNELSDPITETIIEDTEYVTEQKDIDGYEHKITEGDETSGVVDGDKTVIYVYGKVEPEIPETPDDPVEPVNPPVDPEQPEDPDFIDIPDEDVPLADVPKTGDPLILWMVSAAVSALGLIWLALSEKKRRAVNG